MRWRSGVALFVAVLSGSCGATGGELVNAALNLTLATAVAGYQRSEGGCYSACDPKSACNPKTGYCERVPCGGECRPDWVCNDTPMGERCEPPPREPIAPAADEPAVREADAGLDAGLDAAP
jgi:hypothetical protein